jgi:outer membrane lipoprotein-sorting protein
MFLFVLGLVVAASPAAAQTNAPAATPLPPKRPVAVVEPGSADQQQSPPAATAIPPEIKPPPVIGGVEIAAVKPRSFSLAGVTAEQKDALDRIDAYFNAIKVMSGSFTQVNADGTRSTGKFWISKPGKMRFQYAAPSRVELVADGRSVAVRDRKLNTQDLYLIGQTPLRFLLADRIDLITDSRVTGVFVEPEWVTVTIDENSKVAGNTRIQLMFSGQDYKLKQWIVTDSQGYDTTVAIFDVDTASRPPDKLFRIDENRTL